MTTRRRVGLILAVLFALFVWFSVERDERYGDHTFNELDREFEQAYGTSVSNGSPGPRQLNSSDEQEPEAR